MSRRSWVQVIRPVEVSHGTARIGERFSLPEDVAANLQRRGFVRIVDPPAAPLNKAAPAATIVKDAPDESPPAEAAAKRRNARRA